MVKYHDMDLEPSEKCVTRQLNRFGEEVFRELLLVKRADNAAQSEYAQSHTKMLDELELVLEKVLEQGKCFSLKSLAINGSDLIAAGVPQGVQIGETLRHLLALVMDGECENKKDELLARIPYKGTSD